MRALADAGSAPWFHRTVEGDVPTRRVVHVDRALALGHLIVSAAAIIIIVVMLVAGTGPEAELECMYVLFGLILAIPSAAFTFAAVRCARLSFREPPEMPGVVIRARCDGGRVGRSLRRRSRGQWRADELAPDPACRGPPDAWSVDRMADRLPRASDASSRPAELARSRNVQRWLVTCWNTCS